MLHKSFRDSASENLLTYFPIKLGILLLINISVITNIIGQSKPVIKAHYTKENGLPSNKVYDIAQDNLGYMWFGTDHGLSRFDGTEFVNYAITDGAPDSEILKFYTDSRGQIWCYTLNGKISTIYDGKILKDSSITGLPLPNLKEKINDIIEFDREIFISTPTKIYILDKSNRIEVLASILYSRLYAHNNSLYAISSNGNVFIYNKNGAFKNFDVVEMLLNSNSYVISSGDYLLSYPLNSSNSWVSIYNLKSENSEVIPFQSQIYNIVSTLGSIYICTSSGLFYFNPNTREQSRVMSEVSVSNYKVDSWDNEWLTTLNDGVYLFKKNNNIEELTTPNDVEFDRLINRSENLFIISKDQHSVWKYKDDDWELVKKAKGRINDIMVIPDNQVLLASNSMEFGNQYVGYSISKKNGFLFYARSREIATYKYHDNIEKIKSIKNVALGHVKKVLDFKDSIVTFQNMQGIFQLDLTKSFELPPIFDRVAAGYVEYISDSVLWIGSKGAGIFRICKKDTIQFTTKDGLFSDYVDKLIFRENKVWAATSDGINILEFDSGQLVTVKDVIGVPGVVSDIEIYKDSIFVTSEQGLCRFPINADFIDSITPKFIFESFESNETKHQLDTTQNLFETSSREFSINFSTIFFSPGQPIYYRYRMISDGETPDDSQWFNASQSPLNFTNLQSDDYILEIQYRAKNTSWQTGVLVNISVLPYWWETIWFKILIILLLSLPLSYVGFMVRIFLKSRNRLKTEKLYAELMARNAQMNPHFMFNALNSVRNFVLTNNVEQSDRYLTAYARLMRKVLDLSDTLLIPIAEEIELIRLYLDLERMRMNETFDFDIKVNDESTLTYKCPSMILQPFAENAVIHGVRNLDRQGFIKIIISQIEDKVVFAIEDNGPGLEVKGEIDHESKGTKIINEKLRLFRETYNFEIGMEKASDPDYGSYINISIPIIK